MLPVPTVVRSNCFPGDLTSTSRVYDALKMCAHIRKGRGTSGQVVVQSCMQHTAATYTRRNSGKSQTSTAPLPPSNFQADVSGVLLPARLKNHNTLAGIMTASGRESSCMTWRSRSLKSSEFSDQPSKSTRASHGKVDSKNSLGGSRFGLYLCFC